MRERGRHAAFLKEAAYAFQAWLRPRREAQELDEEDLRELLDLLSMVRSGTSPGYRHIIQSLYEPLEDDDEG